MSRTSLFDMDLAIFTQFFAIFIGFFFAYPINPIGLVVFYIFQELIHIFKDNFTKFKDNSSTKGTFFQIPGVFSDQCQIQGLFQVCTNPDYQLEDIMELKNVTKFHKILIKTTGLLDRTLPKMKNFH